MQSMPLGGYVSNRELSCSRDELAKLWFSQQWGQGTSNACG